MGAIDSKAAATSPCEGPEKPHELDTLRLLTMPEQFEVITDAMRGEEGDHFIAIIDRIHATWQAMPRTYETDVQGRAALAHLHYFTGGCDWWIVEKDADPDHAGQAQAFGIADLGMGSKLGYISIPELLATARFSLTSNRICF